MFASCFKFFAVCLLLLPAVVVCCARRRDPVDKETQCSYSIKVKTADETDAGTDKIIRLQLSQGDTKTHWIELRKNKNDFERNKLVRFTFDTTCFKNAPCVTLKNFGDGGYHPFSCLWTNQWKCEFVRMYLNKVGKKVNFMANWGRMYKFNEWFGCDSHGVCLK
ncbi:hypothetical protein LSAT2_015658 [Lamellibrachia satsuma]|nr:hypothetical protein LSAT2_015658 [Lamellibrachia satsuma]